MQEGSNVAIPMRRNAAGQPDQNSRQNNQQPARYTASSFYTYMVAGVAALGGLLFGYDTGVISGAELFLVKDFKLTSGSEELAVSAVLIGAIIGAIFGGKMADWLGRRLSLILLGILFGVGAILTAISPNLTLFIVFRIIVGIGIGAASLIAPMYIAEMAPPAVRGKLVAFNQLAITVGIAVAYWVDLAFAAAGASWRPMFAVAVVPAAVLAIGMFFLADTPRWLATKGRWDDAEHALSRIAGSETQNEIKAIRTSMEEEKRGTLRELLRPGLRIALVVGVGLALFQQFVGINTVIYYAPTIFGYAGFKSASGAILATSVVGVVNVLATILSLFLVDRVGRRPLLLMGLVGMVITLTAMGVIFALGAANVGVLILIALLLYIISFAIGMGPVFWLMSAEVFPTRVRGYGQSISTVGNWGANLLISVTFLTLINGIGKPFTFWLYAVLGIAAFIFCLLLVPETKGKRLEQIEAYWRNGRTWEGEAQAIGEGRRSNEDTGADQPEPGQPRIAS